MLKSVSLVILLLTGLISACSVPEKTNIDIQVVKRLELAMQQRDTSLNNANGKIEYFD